MVFSYPDYSLLLLIQHLKYPLRNHGLSGGDPAITFQARDCVPGLAPQYGIASWIPGVVWGQILDPNQTNDRQFYDS